MKYTYRQVCFPLTVAFPVSSSTAAAFRSRPPLRMWQSLQYVAQPRIGFLAVDLGVLDQAVDLGTGGCAFRRIAEQPCFASDHEWLYRLFGGVVVVR